MRHLLARALRRFGILTFDLLVEVVSAFPVGVLQPGRLVVVRDDKLDKWACLSCPGGCGKTINLSLNPARRPRWHISIDFWRRPSVGPSVHQLNACGCHFWIRRGRIEWCAEYEGLPDEDQS